MIYDEEQIVMDAEALFKSKLNGEITKINEEKGAVSGDFMFMEPIDTSKYVFESLDQRLLNYRGFFVMFGLVDSPPRDANETNLVEDVNMVFQVATFDKGEKVRKKTFYKLLRYRKALKQVVMKNPDVFRGYAKPLISSLRPDALIYSSKLIILTAGVDLRASTTAR